MSKTIDLTDLTKEQKLLLTLAEAELSEKAFGFTVERALSFLAESRAEDPEKPFDDPHHRADATGKFKHFLRVKRGWGGFVDAAWPHIDQYAAAAVDAALRFESGE